MDAATIELHETVIRLAKGIVSARERWERANPRTSRSDTSIVAAGPLVALLEEPTPTLKAALGMWAHGLTLERAKARST